MATKVMLLNRHSIEYGIPSQAIHISGFVNGCYFYATDMTSKAQLACAIFSITYREAVELANVIRAEYGEQPQSVPEWVKW